MTRSFKTSRHLSACDKSGAQCKGSFALDRSGKKDIYRARLHRNEGDLSKPEIADWHFGDDRRLQGSWVTDLPPVSEYGVPSVSQRYAPRQRRRKPKGGAEPVWTCAARLEDCPDLSSVCRYLLHLISDEDDHCVTE